MSRTLILIRHAHRDKPEGRLADNGLSEKGHQQAERLRDYYQFRFGSSKSILLSSPKTRCIETLEPIGKGIKIPVQVEEMLDEQEYDESPEKFDKRVKKFCQELLTRSEARILACSHGDWLPMAIHQLTGRPEEMRKGAWAEFEIRDDEVRLVQLIQKINP